MELVCPLCNGLTSAQVACTDCGTMMDDAGMLTDYVGPYSPYELTPQMKQENHGRCAHLLHCPQCGHQSYAIIQSEWH